MQPLSDFPKSMAEQFDAVVRDVLPPHAKPTPSSIAQINAHFGIQLPHDLILFALESRSYSNWFASIGPDFSSPTNIIRINSHWRRRRRTRRIPRSLIAFTLGFDGDFWCFDTAEQGGSLGVQFWSPDEIVYCDQEAPVTAYKSFQSYLRGQVSAWRAANLQSLPIEADGKPGQSAHVKV